MTFECKEIVYSAEHNWDELINITFLNGPSVYLSVSSLVYEDEVGIELNDQVNFMSAAKSDLKCKLDGGRLRFDIEKALEKNNFDDLSLEIVLAESIDKEKLSRALRLLTSITV